MNSDVFVGIIIVGILGIAIVPAVFRLLVGVVRKLREEAIKKWLMDGVRDTGLLATTPEAVFEHNFRVLLQEDRQQAAGCLHHWVMQTIREGKPPRAVDVKRLKKLGRLRAVDASGLALYPDAAHELDGLIRARVFFRQDLTLAGFKDYQPELEEILTRTFEQKHLSPSDAELLRRINCLREVNKFGEHYGGPYFPYPDERYSVYARFQGEWQEFYFDERLALIVVVNRERDSSRYGEVIWERPGARRPELYSASRN